jgi:hypothetical protein
MAGVGSLALRAWVLSIALAGIAGPIGAQPLQVSGNAGFLGEWELTGTMTAKESGRTGQYAGPLTMKHVGLCTHDGAEEKTGEMQLQISASRVNATFTVAGIACSYRGQLSDSYAGTMNCANQEPVPLKLSVK